VTTPFDEAEWEMNQRNGSLEAFGRLWKRGYAPTEDELRRFNSWFRNARPDPRKERKAKVLQVYDDRRSWLRANRKKESSAKSLEWTAEECGEDIEFVAECYKRRRRQL
jgi:hypothetical protein